MHRQAVVAGQFYPGTAGQLNQMVQEYLDAAGPRDASRTVLAMVPHAGYVYSGAVAGKTLGRARLDQTVVLLGPNHTGLGASLAVWPGGQWKIPGGGMEVDEALAAALIQAHPSLAADTAAHVQEHSLEVVLPFLRVLEPKTRIVPVCVAERSLSRLKEVGSALGSALKSWPTPVSLVVSSDMSHYIPHDQAKARDSLAIQAILKLDPDGLHEVVRSRGISMCGVLPMTLGLAAAVELGARKAELVAYATSGEVSGDYGQVVGYAGVLVS